MKTTSPEFAPIAAPICKTLREVFENHPLIGEVQEPGWWPPCSLLKIKPLANALPTRTNWPRCRTIGFEEGVIIRSTLGRMIMAPALIAGHSELDELVENQTRRGPHRERDWPAINIITYPLS